MNPRIEPVEPTAITTLDAVGGRLEYELAIATVFDEFAARLKAFALAAVRDGPAADDLVQESFIRLLREMREGRTPEHVEAWLFRVCANLIASRGRRRSVAERFKTLLVERGHAASPEETVVRRERDRRLADALAELRPEARTALLLAAQGYASAEIGDAIGRSPAATRVLICRSRIRLREAMASQAGEVEP